MARSKQPTKKPPAKKSKIVAFAGRQPTEAEVEKIADRAVKRVTGKGIHPGTNPSLESNPDIKRDDIKRIIGENLKWYGRTPVKTDEECADRLNEFFQTIAQTGEIPTFEKMCIALGTHRETVFRWERGDLGENRSNMVKNARELLASLDAALVSENKIPQVTYIFRSKNFYGMQDKTDVVVTPNTQIEQLDPDKARQRYLDQAEIIED
jgi:hypothetical protein